MKNAAISDTNMNNQITPTTQGQIVKIINPLPGENPAETYLILEDVTVYKDDATIYIVTLTDLQRNISNPTLTPRKSILKSELTVIADSLEAYVALWNR